MTVLKNILLVLLAGALIGAMMAVSFGYQINRTVLNADFVSRELEQTDALGLATEFWLTHLPEGADAYAPAFRATVEELKPWAQQRLRESVRAGLSYLKGETPDLVIEIDSATVRMSLDRNLREQLRAKPPEEIARLPVEQSPAAAEKLHAAIMAELALPDVYRIDLATMRAEQRGDLQELRTVIGWSYTLYYGGVGAVVLFALIMVWLGSLRWIATVMILYGAVIYLLATFSQSIVVAWLIDALFELPATFETHLPQFYANLVKPLSEIGVGSALLGGGLFIFSCLRTRAKGARASA